MAARSGMANLILTMRGICDVGTADVTIGTVAYWSDNHIQDILDAHCTKVWHEPLSVIETYMGGGTIEYLNYVSEYGNFEETTGGTAIFYIEDGEGDKVDDDDYSVDYQRGEIAFDDDTLGTPYYLTGRSYDLNSSAADIWRRKAGQYAASFSFSTDNMRVDKGALISNALRMADYYAKLSPPVMTTFYRSDIDDTAIEQ